jgi:DsbC/DsbD-like thiol-disulfide interchange protein
MLVMRILAAIVLALCAVAPVVAQDSKKETKHLIVTTSGTPETVAPGKRLSLAVDVAPKPKMHVYSPGQAGYIGITLTLEGDPAFTAAKAKYPAGEKIYVPFLKETQLVYAKPFRIAQDVVVGRVRSAETLTIKGTLRYQACDDTVCYLPVTLPLAWTVKLAASR